MKFIQRVQIRNYRSIGACNVELGDVTFLVGQNGSGKSNFLDALRFVADSLRTSLDHALRDRGGINEVRRRSGGHPANFGISLQLELASGPGSYAFEISAMPNGGFEVRREQCVFGGASFDIERGAFRGPNRLGPAPSSDRLYLVSASGLPEFRPVFDALSGMGFYNLNPDRIRELQSPDAGVLLARDGGNLASVLGQIESTHVAAKERIVEFLGKVAPGIQGVDRKAIGPKETLEFRQRVQGAKNPWRFFASNMSDGTLRALGVLVSLFQAGNGAARRVPLVGIEEPEAALHPGAMAALLDALIEAGRDRQILVTSHSPDLLDTNKIEGTTLLAVVSERGATKIAPVNTASRLVLSQHLYSAGELLRLNQLNPDLQLFERNVKQLRLFE